MKDYEKLAQLIIKFLEPVGFFKSIDRISTFYDEPQFPFYSTIINAGSSYLRARNLKLSTEGEGSGGVSVDSSSLALLRSLGEAIERFCMFYPNRNLIEYSKYINLKKKAVDPILYVNSEKVRSQIFGWVDGFDLIKNTASLLPAQLAYLGYHRFNKEVQLSSFTSTGGAGGFDHESTLLRGIYEVVERDSYMTTYLNKIALPRIKISSIKNRIVSLILKKLERYNLQWFLFDMTTDIPIPSFISILVDKTGIGPTISVGTKSSLMAEDAVIGSFEEAYMARLWIRYEIYKRKTNKFNVSLKSLNTRLGRALFWSSPGMSSKIDYLLGRVPVSFRTRLKYLSSAQQLYQVKSIIKKMGLQLYYTDITQSIFKKINFRVYKILIPKLQPLYLNEGKKVLLISRLKKVSQYFGKEKFVLNTFPHPFL